MAEPFVQKHRRHPVRTLDIHCWMDRGAEFAGDRVKQKIRIRNKEKAVEFFSPCRAPLKAGLPVIL